MLFVQMISPTVLSNYIGAHFCAAFETPQKVNVLISIGLQICGQIFCINFIALVCNWYFAGQYFNIVIMSYSSFLIFFTNRYTVCLCFQIIFFFSLNFVEFVYYSGCITLILGLNGFRFFCIFLYFWFLFLHKFIN